MYPLDNYYGIRRTYTHGVKTFYNDFHLGIDLIVPIGTPIYAPFDCRVEKKVSKTVGNAAYVYFDGLVARFLHCKEVYDGEHGEGDIIAISGNTGLSTAPHIHLDLSPEPFSLSSNKRFIDPDKFEWLKEEGEDPMWKEKYDELHARYNARIPELKRERDTLNKKVKQLRIKFLERAERVVVLKRELANLKKKLTKEN